MSTNFGREDRKRRNLKTYLMASASAVGIAGMQMSTGAIAQTQAQAQTASGEAIEEIVVTGSRLVRRDLTAPSPVVTIGSEFIQDSGNVTMEDTLNQMPQLAAGNTSQDGPGAGSGVLTADLRGLDARRTLVLVNGRRFVPADTDGLVDLTSIPDALVERAEIITGGASAVYGSDAIAGAINFILKDDFEGFNADYLYGQTTRGDASTHKVDMTFGTNFADDRGNIVISANYTNRKDIQAESRAFSSQVFLDDGNGGLFTAGSSNIPGTRISLSTPQLQSLNVDFVTPEGELAIDRPCDSVSGVRFGEGGEVLPFCRPQDDFDFTDGNILMRPLERWQFSSLAHFDISDNVQAYAETYFTSNINEFQMAPDSLALQTAGAPRNTAELPDFATNPVLPVPVRQFLSDNASIFDPDGDGSATIINTGRRFNEFGLRDFDFERTSWEAVAGLRGTVGDGWQWDTYYMFQRARTQDRTDGVTSALRLSLALDTVVDPDTGEVVCRQQVLGCVPTNPFGLDSVTPEGADFLTPAFEDASILSRQMAGGSISGELFELPAGPVATAFGAEWRDEQFQFRPSPGSAAGEFGGNTNPANEGDFNVVELFMEARVPILRDMPGIESLSIEGAARVADYSTINTNSTWKLGFEYLPIDWVTIRGNYNRAVRAPNLNELFSTTSIGFSPGVDLCDQFENPTQAQRQLCIQQGVPPQDIDTFRQINVGFSSRTGGNENLQKETVDTYTIGAVLTPDFLPGLSLTGDYYLINVDNAIQALAAQQVVDACFDLVDINAPACQAIVRTPDGQIDFVDATFQNIGGLRTSGVDFSATYSMDLPDFLAPSGQSAQLDLQVFATKVFKLETEVPAAPTVDCAGFFGGPCSGGRGTNLNPDFKMTFNVNYMTGPFRGRIQTRVIGNFDPFEGGTSLPPISEQVYIDLTLNYQIHENVEFFGIVENLTDNQPPLMGFSAGGDLNTDVATFDAQGLTLNGGVRVRF